MHINQPSWGVVRKKCSEKCNKFAGKHPWRIVISVKLFCKLLSVFYWNHASAWVFSCKFTKYFQNTFHKNTYGGLLLSNQNATKFMIKYHEIKFLCKDLILDFSDGQGTMEYAIMKSLKQTWLTYIDAQKL